MNIVSDLQLVYKKAGEDTLRRIKNNPVIVVLPAVYSVAIFYIMLAVNRVVLVLSPMLSGWVTPLVEVLILSSFFYIMHDLIRFDRIHLNRRGFQSSFTEYFLSIYSVYFILAVARMILPVASGLIAMVFFIGFNVIAEEIYLGGESYLDAYTGAFRFIKDNLVHWFLPVGIYTLIAWGLFAVNPLTFINVVKIPLGLTYYPGFGVSYFVFQVITAVYAVFRGSLYSLLKGSSMRKRTYMGGF
ncbi:hypothetical protein O6R05_05990 [Peptoniphilus equinus]|uniref:ABC-2 type transport system permease protein n=1 Tax=Peptoniphilus equinus TaxID=3016343 RepID=A0ABY7QTY0_9FIRM|nr:hypothetical protein [Peptoniphilus equinus]WBW49544.1 hypothetical protein O6R05_05990 [Peptoniphilus equinus]